MKKSTRLSGNSISRRDLLSAGSVAFVPVALRSISLGDAGVASPQRAYEGSTLSGWNVVVGDGLWRGPGEAAVELADIATVHRAGHSELQANIRRRHVMAHNITYHRIDDDAALKTVHRASYRFRLPHMPSALDRARMGQSIEGGVAIWDGSGSRQDFQVLFQWLVNPLWPERYGTIQAAIRNRHGDGDWTPVGRIEPDTNWHHVEVVIDPVRRTSALAIDGVSFPSTFHGVNKPASWGPETSARLQAEIVSVYPGSDDDLRAVHTAEFRDWSWIWEPADCRPGTPPPPTIPPPPPTPVPTETPVEVRELYRWRWIESGRVEGPGAVPAPGADELLLYHGDLLETGRLVWHIVLPGVVPCRPRATSIALSITGGSPAGRRAQAEEIAEQVAAAQGIWDWRALQISRWCP